MGSKTTALNKLILRLLRGLSADMYAQLLLP